MRLIDFIKNVGRPLTYYPSLAIKLGGVKPAILLCQFLYWYEKSKKQGWVYKTQEEIREETGLIISEQNSARKILGGLNLLEERNVRSKHRNVLQSKHK